MNLETDLPALIDAMVSHVGSLGYFERINTHEPKQKNAAGPGLTAAFWLQSLNPIRSSGLNTTSGRLEFMLRIYTPMLAEPQDDIDPTVLRATSAVLAAFSGDFTLGAIVRAVDLLGAEGTALSCRAGYLELGGKHYRVMDVTVPLLINDLWDQGD
jgi:hypothetical protein